MQRSKTIFAALAGLMIMMGAKCSSERTFTCRKVEGFGYHKVTLTKCTGAEVKILNGKLYVKKKGKCTTKPQVYWGKYAYQNYTGKDGTSFDVELSDVIKLGAAAAGVSSPLE